ncbi:MAG: PKD domain-containing protein, partial [Candidatus Bipolaricaulis sp.]|nr:PKD domain-containing protein [Candidatus Bipolaricaulis sp.]
FTLDAGASIDPSPRGRIARYEWDYDGNGTYDESTSSAVVRHAYEQDGSFSVRVRVVDDDGASAVSDPVLLTVRNRPPAVATPRWSPRPATDGDEVEFEAAASDPDGEVVAWEWTFGDGAASEEIRARHRFLDDGCFFASVRVIDDDGAVSESVLFPVDIANAAPEAAWETFHADGCARGLAFDATASYDPSPTGVIVHVAWDFGDGTSCPGGENTCGSADRWRPVHCYAAPGSYTITLILLDEEGAIARLTRQIVILD